MNRRQAIPVLGAMPLALAGCLGGPSVTRRFRVIATAEVDGEKVEGSTVMEITYTRSSNPGGGGSTKLYGEALILDLKGKGAVFILPWTEGGDGGISQVYEYAVLTALGIQGGVGVLNATSFERIRAAKGRRPFHWNWDEGRKQSGYPAFVSFRDEQDQWSLFEVQPHLWREHFPGAQFLALELEFTDAPITEIVLKRLRWIRKSNHQGVGKRVSSHLPSGKLRGMNEMTLTEKLHTGHFFAIGSR